MDSYYSAIKHALDAKTVFEYIEVLKKEFHGFGKCENDCKNLQGHEFDAVIMLETYEGEWPAKLATDIEERRLFYVAMTRTKQYLYFVWKLVVKVINTEPMFRKIGDYLGRTVMR